MLSPSRRFANISLILALAFAVGLLVLAMIPQGSEPDFTFGAALAYATYAAILVVPAVLVLRGHAALAVVAALVSIFIGAFAFFLNYLLLIPSLLVLIAGVLQLLKGRPKTKGMAQP